MKRKCIAAFALAFGATGVVPVAVADASVSLYGSLRYGVEMTDKDDKSVENEKEDAMWNLGSNRSSRWGIKGSMPAGEGLTAGFKMERAIGGTGSPSKMTARHHHVYLSGDAGTFTFGQQDAPYYGGTTWDGSQTLGGATDFLFRSSGVSYASNLGGPFNFKVLVGSGKGGAEKEEDGANHLEMSASFAAGPVNLNLGFYNDDDMTKDGKKYDGKQHLGGTVGGSVGPVNWTIGYDSGENVMMSLMPDEKDPPQIMGDQDRYGFHLGYAVGESGNLYMQYSARDWTDSVAAHNAKIDLDSVLVGYTHVLAKGVVVYGEFSDTSMSTSDGGTKVSGKGTNVDTSKAVVAVKVSF